MTAACFLDTNILVYAYNTDGGPKHEVSRQLLEKLWKNQTGILSTQVLIECAAVLTGKYKQTAQQVVEWLEPYQEWHIIGVNLTLLTKALGLKNKFKFSFWDSLILQAALESNTRILYSEDFQHGQKIGGLTILNPFIQL